MLSTTLLTLSGLVSFSTAQYVLQDDYSTDSFFSMFDFFTDADPTKGYVTYVDQSTASSANLISTDSGSVYMGVDYTNVASGSGRQSVRITSKNSYNTGLVILDLAHMPGSVCGTWPAFWMVGPDWPNNGEIDIIEGVNSQKSNHMALHTSDGCTLTNATISYTGQMTSSNCYVKAPGQDVNAGCGIGSSATTSYGDGFNNANGGVYATEITSDGISIWHFPRASIPSDITSGSPDPSGWGEASASFSGDCDFSSHFKSMQIVFDTTFCGDWAGNVWSSDATCSAQASTCQDYVQNNPSDFQDSFWTVNSLKVYSGSSSSYAEEEYEGDSDQTTVSESVSVYASYSLPTEEASIAIDVTVAGTTESVSASTETPTETSTPANNRGTWGWGRGGRASWTHVNNAGKFVIQPTATALESALESALGSALEPALGSVPVQTQDTAASAPEVGIAEENSTVNEIPGIEDDRTQGDYDVSKNVHEHIIKHRKRSHGMERAWKA